MQTQHILWWFIWGTNYFNDKKKIHQKNWLWRCGQWPLHTWGACPIPLSVMRKCTHVLKHSSRMTVMYRLSGYMWLPDSHYSTVFRLISKHYFSISPNWYINWHKNWSWKRGLYSFNKVDKLKHQVTHLLPPFCRVTVASRMSNFTLMTVSPSPEVVMSPVGKEHTHRDSGWSERCRELTTGAPSTVMWMGWASVTCEG